MLSIKAMVRLVVIAFFSTPMMIEAFASPTDTTDTADTADTDTGLAQTSSALVRRDASDILLTTATLGLGTWAYRAHRRRKNKRIKKAVKKAVKEAAKEKAKKKKAARKKAARRKAA
ncbi:hypothetical protein OnM2_028109, partial [Erysiphe neolycopersici]